MSGDQGRKRNGREGGRRLVEKGCTKVIDFKSMLPDSPNAPLSPLPEYVARIVALKLYMEGKKTDIGNLIQYIFSSIQCLTLWAPSLPPNLPTPTNTHEHTHKLSPPMFPPPSFCFSISQSTYLPWSRDTR